MLLVDEAELVKTDLFPGLLCKLLCLLRRGTQATWPAVIVQAQAIRRFMPQAGVNAFGRLWGQQRRNMYMPRAREDPGVVVAIKGLVQWRRLLRRAASGHA